MKPISHFFVTILVATLSITSARAQSTQLVSLDSNGVPAPQDNEFPRVSTGGRYVVFSTVASLVPADTNGRRDVYVRDRVAQTTERLSVDSSGAQADGESVNYALSPDGRYSLFISKATNLVAGDTNGAWDVFLRDRVLGVTTRESIGTGGIEGAGDASSLPSMSRDARFVVFSSIASNLVAGDVNGVNDVFVRDRTTGITTCESLDALGGNADGASYYGSISDDGRWVLFFSFATDLVAGDTNGKEDAFLRDRTSGTTTRISVSPTAVQGNNDSNYGAITPDGRFAAFSSYASNLVAGDTNVGIDVFVRDLASGTTTRVDVASDGSQAPNGGEIPSISADGRFVAFQSMASNLAPGDTNQSIDAFVHDRVTHTTTCVSVDSLGSPAPFHPNQPSYGIFVHVSADGAHFAFQGQADLTPVQAPPIAGAQQMEAFVRGPEPFPPFPYCFGNAGTSCPCGPSAAGHGCPNSDFASGALLSASGATSVTSDTLSLTASSMSGPMCLFFQGVGSAELPLGGGKLCLSGALVRIGTYATVGGAATNPSGVDLPISVKGNVPASGATRYYQAVYRNVDASFCGGHRYNRTNGLAAVWYP